LGFNIHLEFRQYKFAEVLDMASKKNDSFSFYLSIAVLLAGLTKPGEVGEMLAIYRLKSISLGYKSKLKSPCFFLQVTLFLQIIFVLL
jgi:hypothetical protein